MRRFVYNLPLCVYKIIYILNCKSDIIYNTGYGKTRTKKREKVMNYLKRVNGIYYLNGKPFKTFREALLTVWHK